MPKKGSRPNLIYTIIDFFYVSKTMKKKEEKENCLMRFFLSMNIFLTHEYLTKFLINKKEKSDEIVSCLN